MPSTASLPNSNFRLAVLGALALVTIGATVVDVETIASTDGAPATTIAAPDTTLLAPPDTSNAAAFGDLGDAATPEVTVAEPAATEAESAAEPLSELAWATDDFTVESERWSAMSGSWAVEDGRFVQSDGAGFDLIAQFGDLPPTEFSISVEMTALDGPLGGGIVIGQPIIGSRRGATLIDFTDSGRFLRWGVYNEDSGLHEYVGGLSMGDDFDETATHTVTVESRATRTMIIIDGAPIGDFAAVPPGHVGLAASLSTVAFDNVTIVEL